MTADCCEGKLLHSPDCPSLLAEPDTAAIREWWDADANHIALCDALDRLRARLAAVEAMDATTVIGLLTARGGDEQPATYTCDRCPAWKVCEHELNGEGDRG